ncbi:MAG: hypothetical protein ACXAC2_06360, partial [Candidatus Kariarchaeaceae archaeon]
NSLDFLTLNLSYNDIIYGESLTGENFIITGNYSVKNLTITSQRIALEWFVTIDPNHLGSYNVTFTFNQTGYEIQGFTVTLIMNSTKANIITGGNSQFTGEGSVLSIYYHNGTKDNLTILMAYNDTIYNQILENATFTIPTNTSSIVLLQEQLLNGTYKIIIQPNATGTFQLQFSFNQYGYQSFLMNITLQVNTTLTTLAITDSGIWYDGAKIDQFFDNNSLDELSLTLQYNDSIYGDSLLGNNLNITGSYTTDNLSIIAIRQGLEWIITIDPNHIGSYNITFTFNQTGYQTQSFMVTLSINSTLTEVIVGGNTQFTGNGSVLSVYYHNGTRDNLSILMTFNDTVYNQVLDNASLDKIFNDLVMNLVEIIHLNNTIEIIIQPNKTGIYQINFTFSQYGYNSQFITITIEVNTTSTSLTTSNQSIWFNGSLIEQFYENNSLDQLSVYLGFNDSIHDESLAGNNLFITGTYTNDDLTIISQRSGLEWFVIINPNHVGIFNVTFTFNQSGYQIQMLTVTLKINATFTNLLIGGNPQFTGNGSILNVYYHNGTKDNLSILLTLNDTIYNQILNKTYLVTPGNNQLISYIDFNHVNGTIELIIQPNATGTFQLAFSIQQYGYLSKLVNITLQVNITPTTLIQGGHTNFSGPDSNITVLFDEGQGDLVTVYVTLNDTIYNDTLNGLNLFITPGDSFAEINSNAFGNGTIRIDLDPTDYGTKEFNISISQTGYQNQTVSITLFVNVTFTVVEVTGEVFTNQTSIDLSVYYHNDTLDTLIFYMTYKDAERDQILNNTVFNSEDNSTDLEVFLYFFSNETVRITLNPLISGNFIYNFSFSKSGYETKDIALNLDVNITLTNYTVSNPGIWHHGSVINQYFDNNSLDLLSLSLTYNDTIYNESLAGNNLYVTGNYTIDNLSISSQRIGLEWTVLINPNHVGIFNITFTFNQSGYQIQTFTVTLRVNSTLTEILVSSNSQFIVNGSILSVYYHNGTKDNLSVLMTFNDTIYNQVLNNASFNRPPDTLSISLLEFYSPNGTFEIIIQPNATGTFSLFFTFSQLGYVSLTMNITIEINTTLTDYTTNDPGTWFNGSVISQYYDVDFLDELSLNLSFSDIIYSESLAGNNLFVSGNYTNENLSIITQRLALEWIVRINPNHVGSYLITFIFNQSGYQIQSFSVILNVNTTPVFYTYYGPSILTSNFSESDFDNLSVLLTYEDSIYNRTLNQTLVFENTTETVAFSTSVFLMPDGNFSITINPKVAENFTIEIFLTQQGYQNITIFLNISISIADINISSLIYEHGQDIANVTQIPFGNESSLIVNLTNQFDNISLENVNINTSSQDVEIIQLVNGSYEIKFKGATKWFEGSEIITITLSKNNFNFKIFYWSVNITVPTTKFVTEISSQQVDYSGEWGNSFNVTIKFVDPIHNIWINGSHPLYSNPDVNIIPLEVNNGSHVIQITPKTVGSWQLIFTLNPGFLDEYFESANITMTINGLRRTTADVFELTSSIIEVVYQRNVVLEIKWKDAILIDQYANLSQTPSLNNNNWANYDLFEPGSNT